MARLAGESTRTTPTATRRRATARPSRCAAAAARSELPARVTARIQPGHVFTAFHFPEVRTNLLIGPSADVNTSCPEYKVVAVAIEPVGERVGEPVARHAAPLTRRRSSCTSPPPPFEGRHRRRGGPGRRRAAPRDPAQRRARGRHDANSRSRPRAGGRASSTAKGSSAPRGVTPPTTSRRTPWRSRAPDAVAPPTRRLYTTSSCGICGKGALEEVEAIAPR